MRKTSLYNSLISMLFMCLAEFLFFFPASIKCKSLVEILKQPQYQPLSMEKQVTILFAGTRGFLDALPIDVLAKYEAGLYKFIEDRFPKVFEGLKEKQAIDDDLDKLMREALTAYGEEFKDTIK